MRNTPEALADATRSLLWAIDGGYFSDSFLAESAFVTAVRDAYEHETGRSPWPRDDADDAPPTMASRPGMDGAAP